MTFGSRLAWATRGEGRYSMTETSKAVERGSQAANSVVRIALGSFERRICGGIVRDNDLVIFSIMAGSLGVPTQ